MALTTHVKTSSVNLTTGERQETYYDDAEWEKVLVARAAKVLTIAKVDKRLSIDAEAQARVDGIVSPYELKEAQIRALELLEYKLTDGLSVEEEEELAELKAKRALCKSVRVAQGIALSILDDAETVAEVEAVTL